MGLASFTRRLTRRRAQLGFFSTVLVVCLLAVAFLATQVFLKLDEYASAGQDNVPWSFSRLEVDHLKLLSSLRDVNADALETIETANRRFDALYSRAAIISEGPAYDPILAQTRAAQALTTLNGFISQTASIMDQGDASVVQQQDKLIELTTQMSEPIRQLSSVGIATGARLKEEERAALNAKLIQVTLLSILLLITLMSLAALLWQLYRLYRQRALENRQTLNRLATILDTSQDAVVVVRTDGSINHTNRAANAMFFGGEPPGDETRISNVLMKRTPDGSLTGVSGETLLASCQDAPNLCANLTGVTAKGEQFPIELSADKAVRAGQDIVVCFVRNITRRMADQTEILAARDKALSGEKAKARFLGTINHEMRTPLTGILGALDLLDDTAMSAKQRTYTQIMQSSGQILLNQINDALDIAQADQIVPEVSSDVFDVDAMITTLLSAQRPLAHKASNALTRSTASQDIGLVRGDRDRVYQVLLNLLSNAIKFTSEGTITIEATRTDTVDGGTDQVEFQVIDTGIGIPADDQARIFEDFVRLEAPDGQAVEGTGLGLGIVRNLVVMMGGEIGLESEPDAGSLFWVRLPLPPATAETSQLSSQLASTTQAPNRCDVLIVEDNEINRTVLAELLEKEGHHVWTATDGADAVTQAAARQFDLIFMDINMPVLDGILATAQIRGGTGASSQARIIALSAHISPDIRAAVIEAGCDAVLTKPLRREDLGRVLSGQSDQPPETTADPDMDDDALEQLAASLSPEAFDRLLTGFKTQGTDLISDLPDLKGEELPARLHDFAGLSATLGARALHSCLSQAELAIRAGDATGSMTALQILPKVWDETLAHLDKGQIAA